MLPEIGLAIMAVMLALLFVRIGRSRGKQVGARPPLPATVSLDDMNAMISELAPSLRETAMVTAPQTYVDRGHIWASPCGKRVYIN